MGKKIKTIMVGAGNIGKSLHKIAMTDMKLGMMLSGPVQLKECHKTPEQKQAEVIQKLREGLNDKMIMEYLLIINKKSDLSRAKRDYIVSCINQFVVKGALTKEELELLNTTNKNEGF